MERALHCHVRQHRATTQCIEFQQDGHGLDGRAALTQQLDRRVRGATRCEHVVDDEDALALVDRLGVDFHARRAVLEFVVDADHVAGQLASLADRQHSEAKLGGHGGTEDEATRLKTRDCVDATRVASADQLNQFLERRAVRKQLSDIAEQNAGFRKIRDLQHVVLNQSGDAIAKLTEHR